MVTNNVSAGNTIGTHAGKRRVGAVAGLDDTAGCRHNIAHAKNLTGIDVMDKFSDIIISRIGQHLLRRIDLYHTPVA